MKIELSRTKRGLLIAVLTLSFGQLQVRASSCAVDPATPTSGHPVTVIYDPVGGPLAGAGTVYVHKGENGWKDVVDIATTFSNGLWYVTYPVPQGTYQLNFVFTDLAGTWDNNNNQDWHFRTGSGGAGIMMQGFYWNCPQGWYSTMTENASALRYMQGGYGIDRIWFPPPSKADSGGFSMGYDPYDYYDLGQYNQQGSTSTRFGTQTDLKNTIAAYKNLGVATMADLVLNHRSGGASESNPNTGGTSYTDFGGVASGECTWNYNEFHPSTYEVSDPGTFPGFIDVCHVTANLPGSANYDLTEWGNWLMDPAHAGFDGGWRFDYPKGIHASFIADFRMGTGDDFGILEYWDGNISLIEDYVNNSGVTSAFDFPAFYTMIDVFNNGQHIGRLIDNTRVYAAKDPVNAVTFVANHDTDKESTEIVDKMLAYAYILTYQGYPCIFWKDYYDYGLAGLGGQSGNGINPLVWVRGALGGGQPEIQLLKTDSSDLLVYGTRNGSGNAPGYIVVINNNATASQSATVTTANSFLRGKTLQCHAWYSYVGAQNTKPADVSCSAGGVVTVQAPPRGYAVYSVSAALPASWSTKDVGLVGVAGSATHIEDNFVMTGSGADIQGTADAFRYVYQTVSGDCAIQARVVSLENTDPLAKAGVMIRQNMVANAKNAAVLVTPDNGVIFQWRSSASGITSMSTLSGVSAPCWVRLEYTSKALRGYYSLDGVAWTQIGSSQTIDLFSTPKVGLATTSHDNKLLTTSIMENVDLNTAPVLATIDDQTLIAGGTLTLTNSASDADLPAQTLTYGLIDPPSGASIDTTNGVFSWRPLISQAPSTQTVSVVVADDGVPPLDATQDFTVTVALPAEPVIGSSTITNGFFGFSINGDTGPDYTILTTTNLMAGWTSVFTFNSPIPPFFWADTNQTASPVQFYRVELGP